MNTNHKVGIIGAGNGGLALMFELINNGVDLLTYHKTEFSKTITPVFTDK